MARDDFTEATKKILAERVGYRCSNPFCRRMTIGPQTGDKKTVNIGEAAHICAASPGGKRYNSEMTVEERKAPENGIWMCRTHAALIDRDEKYFTVEMLKKWKGDAESEAGRELIGQEVIKKCRFRMLIFYNDLVECKKTIKLLKTKRGLVVNGTLLPIQKDWEIHLEEISDSIGAEVTANIYNIFREIEEFKEEMKNITQKMNGKRVADMNTVQYCGRYDIFIDRMENYLTNDFIETIKFYTELL